MGRLLIEVSGWGTAEAEAEAVGRRIREWRQNGGVWIVAHKRVLIVRRRRIRWEWRELCAVGLWHASVHEGCYGLVIRRQVDVVVEVGVGQPVIAGEWAGGEGVVKGEGELVVLGWGWDWRRESVGGFVGGDYGGDGGAVRHVGVDEVGAGLGAAHGPGGTVICQCRLLGRVECSEPMPLLCRWVSNFSCVSPPRSPPHSKKPCGLLLLLLLLLFSSRLRRGCSRVSFGVGEVHMKKIEKKKGKSKEGLVCFWSFRVKWNRREWL